MNPGTFRSALTRGIYIAKGDDPQANLQKAYELGIEAETILKKISVAVRSKTLPKGRPTQLVETAVEAGVITPDEAQTLRQAESARSEAIAVDSFNLEDYRSGLLETPSVAE